MKYIIIGTAGHVDHGKTALIKALTGTDTDRLLEEKQRGISIDLGFAALSVTEDLVAGIVDVPGHERFLKNMLAGTGGLDMAILVVAADEGVMPQTREHLAMLSLYGVRYGVIVISKVDKVEDDWIELIQEEIRSLTVDTFLSKAPICKVSAVTGKGLDTLKRVLAETAEHVPPRDSEAPFRMWIDRVFTIKGHGAVVTGSILSGTLSVGDTLVLQPAGCSVRVRGLEWHGEQRDIIQAGQRAAINLGGIDFSEINRGMMLSAPGYGEVSDVWQVVGDLRQDIVSGLRVRVHIGTKELLGRIYQFKDASISTTMRLLLEEPLAAAAGDRGIIRMYSPQLLIGGIMMVSPVPQSRRAGKSRLAMANALLNNDKKSYLEALLITANRLLALEEIVKAGGYWPKLTSEAVLTDLAGEKRVIQFGDNWIHSDALQKLYGMTMTTLEQYHRDQPDKPGLSQELLRQRLNLTEKHWELISRYWQEQEKLVIANGEVALKEHVARHTDWRIDLVQKAEEALKDSGLTSIDRSIIADRMKLPPDKAGTAHEMLLRKSVLIKVGDSCLYHKTLEWILEKLRLHFEHNQGITVADFRDLLNTSRKMALPLLEYLDLHKYTIRDGDIRRIGIKLRKLPD